MLVLIGSFTSVATAGSGEGWGAATIIATDFGDADRPHVALDPVGNAIAVWYQWDGSAYSIYANRFAPTTGWGTAVRIENSNIGHAGYPYGSPRVALDSAGNGVAVWTQYDGQAYKVWASRFVGGEWGTAMRIEDDNAGLAYLPRVGINPSGEAFAVWQKWDGSRYNIWAVRLNGGAWGLPASIENGGGTAQNPDIAVDDGGNALAVWTQYDGSGYNVWANRFADGAWGLAGKIETANTADWVEPRVAMNPAGNAIAVWRQYDYSTGLYNIWANRFTPATGWDNPVPIETNNLAHAGYPYGPPQVAIDSAGTGVAVWSQYDGRTYSIWANEFVSGAWQTAALIETENMDVARDPKVSMDGSGRATAVWWQYDGYLYNAWANRFVPGKGWGTATLIERPDRRGHAYYPEVAVDASGNAVAVWMEYSGGRYTIWANRFVRDNIPPFLVVSSPADDITTAATVTVAGITEPGALLTVNGAATSVSPDGSYSTSVALTEGQNVIVVIATDYERNSAQRSVLITRDTTPPVPNISAPGDGAILSTHVVRVTGTASDSGSGVESLSVNGVALSQTSPWALDLVLEEGSQTLVVTAQDRAGNTATVTRAITIDTLPPSLLLTSPAEVVTNVATMMVSGTTEPGARVIVNGVAVTVNPSGAFFTPVPLTEGANTITVDAIDAAGNTAAVVRSITRDSTPPRLAVTTPVEGAMLATNVVRVAGTATDAMGVSELSVNGFRIVANEAGAWSVDLALSEGVHTIATVATDRASNEALDIRTVTVDTVAPSLVLTLPSEDLTRSATVIVGGRVELGAGVTVNGSPASVAADGTFSMSVALAEGVNPVTVVATDGAGRTAKIVRSIIRDSTPPSLSVNTPTDGSVLTTNVVRVSGTAEVGAELAVNGVVVHVEDSGAWSLELALSAGTIPITAIAMDSAGNTASASVTVTIDIMGLRLALTSPVAGQTNNPDVVVAGGTEPGASVTVDGAPVAVDASGAFATTVTQPEGTHTFIIIATARSGNTANASVTVTVDTTPPSVAITSPVDRSETSLSTATVAGTTEPGAHIVINGITVRVGADGFFSTTLALVDGSNGIVVVATDAAGNARADFVSVTYTNPVPELRQDLQSARAALGFQMTLLLVLLLIPLAIGVVGLLRARKPRSPPPATVAPQVEVAPLPEEFRQTEDELPRTRGELPRTQGEPEGATVALVSSVLDDARMGLQRIEQLRAEGAVTDDEYQAKRKEILDRV